MSERHDGDGVLDEELSALLDGELAPAREAELRARAAREPELAARLAALRGVGAALRGLPGPAVPPDLLARVKQAAAAPAAPVELDDDARRRLAEVRAGLSSARRRAGRRGRAPRRRWLAALGALATAAALAGLALWTAPRLSGRRGGAPPPEIARAPVRPAPPRAPVEPTPRTVARAPVPRPAPVAPAAPPPPAAPAEASPPAAEEEDLALAMELEAIDDLELIERLDLLEFLARQRRG
jgi:hypothetical protein